MKVVFISGNFQKDATTAECDIDGVRCEFYRHFDNVELIEKSTRMTVPRLAKLQYIESELRSQAEEISKRIPMFKIEKEDDQMEALLESKLGDFKKQLAQINEDVLSNLYTDVLPYVLSDTQFNMVGIIDDCLDKILKGSFEVEIDQWDNYTITVTDQNGFDHTLRESSSSIWGTLVKKIYDANPQALESAHIKQLEARIESLQDNLTRAYSR